MVETGVYRSAFPRTKNIAFLKQLHLKGVVSLVPEDYPTAMAEIYRLNGINLLCHGLDGNKWPFKEIDHVCLQKVLDAVLNPANRPLLIHCNKGKHRTGSVVGSLRKIRGWALSAIYTEYLLYAAPKSRLEDQLLIETFQYDYGSTTTSIGSKDERNSNSGKDIEEENSTSFSNSAPYISEIDSSASSSSMTAVDAPTRKLTSTTAAVAINNTMKEETPFEIS
mmetsp:Transcript_23361/g.39099  ORF Transcript_23361/g.39099 Transcript_23361/m.39099 type:complete len:223 (+) Transcript_23361:22-690(+)